jgi:hypothetical protein
VHDDAGGAKAKLRHYHLCLYRAVPKPGNQGGIFELDRLETSLNKTINDKR